MKLMDFYDVFPMILSRFLRNFEVYLIDKFSTVLEVLYFPSDKSFPVIL